MSDWVVVKNWSGYSALPVVKRTDKRVVAKENNRDRHFRSDEILAVLPEDLAKAMAERLVSSAALWRTEAQKASERHLARVAAIKAEFAQ